MSCFPLHAIICRKLETVDINVTACISVIKKGSILNYLKSKSWTNAEAVQPCIKLFRSIQFSFILNKCIFEDECKKYPICRYLIFIFLVCAGIKIALIQKIGILNLYWLSGWDQVSTIKEEVDYTFCCLLKLKCITSTLFLMQNCIWRQEGKGISHKWISHYNLKYTEVIKILIIPSTNSTKKKISQASLHIENLKFSNY